MTKYFDGRKKAKNIENNLVAIVTELRNKGITPKLASIQIGNNKASALYLKLKQEAAERIGAKVEIHNLTCTDKMVKKCNLDYKKLVDKLNKDKKIHGIMLQLPLPKMFDPKDRDRLISMIKKTKDVDGMRLNGKFSSPVVRAVMLALEESCKKDSPSQRGTVPSKKVLVVGALGFEGRKIMHELRISNYELRGTDKDNDIKRETVKADVIISATGIVSLIKPDMVKDDVVLIDVGAPIGDIDKSCYEKASFVTPIPGGIGPVVVSCLLENLVNSIV